VPAVSLVSAGVQGLSLLPPGQWRASRVPWDPTGLPLFLGLLPATDLDRLLSKRRHQISDPSYQKDFIAAFLVPGSSHQDRAGPGGLAFPGRALSIAHILGR